MYALNFLNEHDIIKVQSHFERSIGDWITNYSFSRNCSADISYVRAEEIEKKDGTSYTKDNGNVALIVDNCTNLEWQKIIFCDFLHLCPEGEKLNQLANELKTKFLHDVLTIDNTSHKSCERISLLSIDAFLHLRISIEGINFINVFAPHSFFASIIGKSELSKSSIKLQSIKEAITPIKVPVSFKLNFGPIPFGEILKMEIGTVLRSSYEMDNTFSMALNDNPIANVSMGKTKNNIAFLVKGK